MDQIVSMSVVDNDKNRCLFKYCACSRLNNNFYPKWNQWTVLWFNIFFICWKWHLKNEINHYWFKIKWKKWEKMLHIRMNKCKVFGIKTNRKLCLKKRIRRNRSKDNENWKKKNIFSVQPTHLSYIFFSYFIALLTKGWRLDSRTNCR